MIHIFTDFCYKKSHEEQKRVYEKDFGWYTVAKGKHAILYFSTNLTWFSEHRANQAHLPHPKIFRNMTFDIIPADSLTSVLTFILP